MHGGEAMSGGGGTHLQCPGLNGGKEVAVGVQGSQMMLILKCRELSLSEGWRGKV